MAVLDYCFHVELEFGKMAFAQGRETGGPGEKTPEQGREPTTYLTHM